MEGILIIPLVVLVIVVAGFLITSYKTNKEGEEKRQDPRIWLFLFGVWLFQGVLLLDKAFDEFYSAEKNIF